MDSNALGKWLLVVGLAVACIGGLLMLVGRFGWPKLPGDLTFRRGGVTIHLPLASSLLLSLLLTLILNILARLFRK